MCPHACIHSHKVTLAYIVQLETAKVVANEESQQLGDVPHKRDVSLGRSHLHQNRIGGISIAVAEHLTSTISFRFLFCLGTRDGVQGGGGRGSPLENDLQTSTHNPWMLQCVKK